MAESYHQRRKTHWQRGDFQTALEDASYCVELEPQNAAYAGYLIANLLRLGKYQEVRQEKERLERTVQTGGWLIGVRLPGTIFEMLSQGYPSDMLNGLEDDEFFGWLASFVDLYQELDKIATRTLTATNGTSSFSPDGKQLAYGRSEMVAQNTRLLTSGGPTIMSMSRGIEVLDLETHTTRLLVNSGRDPAWSPDGRYIAFVREPDYLHEYQEEVWLVSATGGDPKRLALGGAPCWSRDAKRLYFHSRISGTVCCIDIDSTYGQPSEVVECLSLFPQVSPDETKIAYLLNGTLTVLDMTSGHELFQWAVPGAELWQSLRWSWDSKELFLGVYGFYSPSSGVWIVDIERKEGWQVLDRPIHSIRRSMDRSHLSIEVSFPVWETWVTEVDPQIPTAQLFPSAQPRHAYVSEEWTRYETWFKHPSKGYLKPTFLDSLTAVGVSQFDSGHMEQALGTLTRTRELRQAGYGGKPTSMDATYISMIQQTLTGDNQDSGLQIKNSQFSETWKSIRKGRLDHAKNLLEKLKLAAVPDSSEMSEVVLNTTKALAQAFHIRGKREKHQNLGYALQLKSFQTAVQLEPNNVSALRDLAWILAVCPRSLYRNGTQAKDHASRACTLTQWEDPLCLTILAAAWAELGDFTQAVKTQQQGLDVSSRSLCAGWQREMQERLALYQSNRHLHTDRINPLLARWSFDKTDAKTVRDDSGNGFDGILKGDPKLVPGRFGRAVQLDGDGDYLDCGSHPEFKISQAMTISVWMKMEDFQKKWWRIIAKGTTSWRLAVHFYFGSVEFSCWSDRLKASPAGDILQGRIPIDDGAWHHVAGVYDGSDFYLYIDGKLDHSQTAIGPIPVNDQPVWIGSNSESQYKNFTKGQIDDIRIYRTALTQEDIKALAQGKEPKL